MVKMEIMTLEEELTDVFEKRGIMVIEVIISVRKGEYKFKVKYPAK